MTRTGIATLLALSLNAGVASAQFCPGLPPWVFDDVPSTHPFCGDVTWLAQRGVTLGCSIIDPNHRLYCPNDSVTRGQMAAFMHRLGDALLPLTCAAGQVMRWSGSAWACAGTVTSLTAGAGIALTPNPTTATGTVAADTTYLQRRVTGTCGAGSSIRTINADGSVACEIDDSGPAGAFVQDGNAFGTTAVVGTTDNQSFDIRVNGNRVMRYEPHAISPNVIGGSPANGVTAGVRGATIAGGGVPLGDPDPTFGLDGPNRVTDAYGAIGGGYGNLAGDDAGSTTGSAFATVGGGNFNGARGFSSTVAGGASNHAGGEGSFIGGGWFNDATGIYSTVTGGYLNLASGGYSTVAGGRANVAAGGYSVAMGRNARAMGEGSFTFADSNPFDFSTTGDNVFRVRATGGVRFITDIDGTGATIWRCQTDAGAGWDCSSDRNQKQNLRLLDGQAVLERLMTLPVFAWNPKGRNAHVERYGPTAQDFHAAFGLGDDATLIGSLDADGVSLAAIQGLNAKLEAKIAEQAREIAELRRSVEQLLARVAPVAIGVAVR